MVLGIIDRFQRDCGMLLPWQNQKNCKMYWTKKNEKLPSLLTKTENQRLNSRKPANRGRHQNHKTAVFKCETWKTEPNIGQIRKTENPNAPLHKECVASRCHLWSFPSFLSPTQQFCSNSCWVLLQIGMFLYCLFCESYCWFHIKLLTFVFRVSDVVPPAEEAEHL